MKDYEQIISTLLVKIAELEKVVQQQASRIGELEKRLSKNSINSDVVEKRNYRLKHGLIIQFLVLSHKILRA